MHVCMCVAAYQGVIREAGLGALPQTFGSPQCGRRESYVCKLMLNISYSGYSAVTYLVGFTFVKCWSPPASRYCDAISRRGRGWKQAYGSLVPLVNVDFDMAYRIGGKREGVGGFIQPCTLMATPWGMLAGGSIAKFRADIVATYRGPRVGGGRGCSRFLARAAAAEALASFTL